MKEYDHVWIMQAKDKQNSYKEHKLAYIFQHWSDMLEIEQAASPYWFPSASVASSCILHDSLPALCCTDSWPRWICAE